MDKQEWQRQIRLISPRSAATWLQFLCRSPSSTPGIPDLEPRLHAQDSIVPIHTSWVENSRGASRVSEKNLGRSKHLAENLTRLQAHKTHMRRTSGRRGCRR